MKRHRGSVRPFVTTGMLALLIALDAGAQTTVEDCLEASGMAFVGGHSAAVARSSSVFLFGGPGGGAVICDPPVQAAVHATLQSSLGEAWLAGTTGMLMSTVALAGPVTGQLGRGFLAGDLIFRFRVVPNDPGSTAPVDVDFVTRTWITAAQLSATGAGAASNGFTADFRIRALPAPSSGPDWEYADLAPTAGLTTDQLHTVTVPVGVDRYFIVSLSQSSYAQALGSPSGSGTAALSTLWSFEASTAADAALVWDVETRLGLAPELDSVPEPELGMMLVLLAAMAGDVHSRRRRGSASRDARSESTVRCARSRCAGADRTS